MNHAYIYDCVRTPRGKGKPTGKIHSQRPIDLAASTLTALKNRNNLDTSLVEDVVLGCVTQVAEQGGCVAKAAAMHADFDQKVAGVTLNRYCGSGLQAINQSANSIISGFSNLIIAGGVESMSRVPFGTDGGSWMIDPELANKTGFIPQGISADLIATINNFSRKDVDQFALNTQMKASSALKNGYFKNSTIPIKDKWGTTILDSDELIRPETTLESLGGLKPAFKILGEQYGFNSVAIQKYPQVEYINHIHHAGNSSGIVDGAAAVLLGNLEIGNQLSIKPKAKIISHAVVSTEPTIMLTGPVPATEKALKHANMNISDIDLIEVNEAFASVVMHFERQFNIGFDKINVNGGSIAMGHPLGATGAILINTLVDELERRDKELGLATLCIGGGMGIATIIQRV